MSATLVWFRQDLRLQDNPALAAAPYFRIVNPISQSLRFDPAGDYVRRWVPGLGRLAVEFIQRPWTAPTEFPAAAGVELGRNYPQPIVDHGEARVAASQRIRFRR